jgi:hypothetical protein
MKRHICDGAVSMTEAGMLRVAQGSASPSSLHKKLREVIFRDRLSVVGCSTNKQKESSGMETCLLVLLVSSECTARVLPSQKSPFCRHLLMWNKLLAS